MKIWHTVTELTTVRSFRCWVLPDEEEDPIDLEYHARCHNRKFASWMRTYIRSHVSKELEKEPLVLTDDGWKTIEQMKEKRRAKIDAMIRRRKAHWAGKAA